MSNVEWCYHRKNCNSCSKTAAFLKEHGIAIKTQLDARTIPLVETDALKLLGEVNELYVTRGTKVIHFNLKHERPDDPSLLELLIGRSGKLRAPAIKVGKTLVVGFDQTTYEQVCL
jgi:arsenate reductase-like glutaredoxin family protein